MLSTRVLQCSSAWNLGCWLDPRLDLSESFLLGIPRVNGFPALSCPNIFNETCSNRLRRVQAGGLSRKDKPAMFTHQLVGLDTKEIGHSSPKRKEVGKVRTSIALDSACLELASFQPHHSPKFVVASYTNPQFGGKSPINNIPASTILVFLVVLASALYCRTESRSTFNSTQISVACLRGGSVAPPHTGELRNHEV
ncbi:hypothetical protein BDN72DRAFT_874468 [Pluteus cervinus]|uniref:Uncharacterized protein n=1 Tax=Pluteus cervinus TaxID=181527 RepID=A0ACD3BCM8_9AGAR|nr:hypothetical protein BDN72DRAFT_874468 [Pluteus cervinus]